MKLIRLVSTDTKGFFDTQFNTEIIVEPNSEIALQSATFRSALTTIDINQSNNRLTFTLTNLTDLSEITLGVVLDEVFYSDRNFQLFFNDVSKKFNEAMIMNSTTLGIDFQVIPDENNLINIGYKRSFYSDFEVLDRVELIGGNTGITLAGNAMFNSNNVSNPDDRVHIISDIPLGNGIKVFRAVPFETIANTDGCKIGLSQTDRDEFVFAEFFIKNNGDGHPYTYLEQKGLAVKASTFNATCTGANPDVMELSIIGDEIFGTIYRHGQANPDILFNTPYSQNDFIDLFPFVSIQAKKDDLTVRHVQFTPDMYFFDSELIPITRLHANYRNLHKKHDAAIADLKVVTAGFTATPIIPRPIGEICEGRLTMARAVANYLGIRDKVTTATEQQFTDSFTGTLLNTLFISGISTFHGSIFTKNFLIELNSIDIESYDSAEGRRRNIIASIPQQEQINVIEYEPNNLYFVNTKNAQTISLRNINARILNIDGSTPTLTGSSVLNLLIK